MKISIIIPNFNGVDLLKACLKSIDQQTFKNYSIIVIDNGSIDNSLIFLNEKSQSIQVIKLKENMGFGRAVNLGIRQSDDELIMVLNNDTILKPNCLEKIIEGVKEYPNYGFFAPCILESNTEKLYAAGLMFSNRGYGNRSQRHYLGKTQKPVELFGTCGAAAIYKLEVLKKVGFFNEDFFFLHEDTELNFRHQLKGYKCLYLPSAKLHHHGSATLKHFFSKAFQEIVKNSLATLITCLPTYLIKKNIFRIIKFYLKFWTKIISKGYFVELLFGVCWILIYLPKLTLRRIRLQTQSEFDPTYLESLLYKDEIYINFPDGVIKF